MWKVIINDGETKYGLDQTWIDVKSRHSLDKLASVGVHVPPTLQAKIEELQGTLPRNKVAFYNRALGSFEAFGLNKNGDGFSREELMRKHATFVDNAHYFRHHQNNDTALSRGRPVASSFNEETDMVDLIIVADMDKCAEQIEALESGKRVPTSMGARVAVDVCTICGNKARNRKEYCKHVEKLANHPFGMRSVLGDGRVCGVMNPNPNFFDISDVIVGASNESETLLKVACSDQSIVSGAELAEIFDLSKLSGFKQAAIVKKIPGMIDGNPIYRKYMSDFDAAEKKIPDEVIMAAKDKAGFSGVIKSASLLGIVFSPSEFAKLAGIESFSSPSLKEVCETDPMPKEILASDINAEATTILMTANRSVFMPSLLNRISDSTAGVKLSSLGNNEDGKRMYAAYRRSLIDEIPIVDASTWNQKCAGTESVMLSEMGRSYLESAFLSKEDESILGKVLDRMKKVAQASTIESVPGNISGTVAEQIGVDALDLFAVHSLRNKGKES